VSDGSKLPVTGCQPSEIAGGLDMRVRLCVHGLLGRACRPWFRVWSQDRTGFGDSSGIGPLFQKSVL